MSDGTEVSHACGATAIPRVINKLLAKLKEEEEGNVQERRRVTSRELRFHPASLPAHPHPHPHPLAPAPPPSPPPLIAFRSVGNIQLRRCIEEAATSAACDDALFLFRESLVRTT